MKAYLNQDADKRIFDVLCAMGFEVIPLAPFGALASPVSSHADMLLCSVDDKIFIPQNYEIKINGKKIIEIDEKLGKIYPDDVALNIAIVGKNVFCNTKYASKMVLGHLEKEGHAIHHVNQGYAHCSTCIVDDNAIITADEGIFRLARENGVEALLISKGHISLPPYSHGFIGGATGTTDNAVYFCGSLSFHPDGEKMRTFINSRGKEVIELSNSPLSDIGGILFI